MSALSRARCLATLAALLAPAPGIAQSGIPQAFWDRLALRDDAPLVMAVKYRDRETRARIFAKALGGADLPFISRVVVRLSRDAALSLEGDPGIADAEIFGPRTADRTFHKLLELYRVYLYQVSGRFSISVVNFSQGVTYFDRNSDERGDRTIAEALDVLGSRIAPVLVAVGDGAEFGVGSWAMAPSVLPVVATTLGGEAILPNSARPEAGRAPWRTVLYADGAPTEGGLGSSTTDACGEGAHLTADQMLDPETARVPAPGGSSYATFKATFNICFVHQYTEILRVLLRARTAIGDVEVEPFVAYYVDSPVNPACPATAYRWADKRYQVEPPRYRVDVAAKRRLDDFVHGNSIELRPNYSIPLLKAFLHHLSPRHYTAAGPAERYVASRDLLSMLRRFGLADLVEVAANRRSVLFERWKATAARDPSPLLGSDLLDNVEHYCRSQTQFLVLSDVAKPFLSSGR